MSTVETQGMLEIVLPAMEPELEWICGRAIQKVSPKRKHAILQARIAAALDAWGRGKGEVGTEWRFRLAPPGEERRPLVPDVAFISYKRTAGLEGADLDAPPVAPDIAVEIFSPGDLRIHITEKRRVYLAAGVSLVLHVDPRRERVDAYRSDGSHEIVSLDAPYTPPEFPGLSFPFGSFFNELKR
jgi:Uma2 family endonuclease